MRPTYNFEKILIWILIFNAILLYAEKFPIKKIGTYITFSDILSNVYPSPVASYVMNGIHKLAILTQNQVNNGDTIGRDIELEQELFDM